MEGRGAGGRVPGHADWYDIGTLEEYERAVQDVQDRPDAFGLGQPVSAGARATPLRRVSSSDR